MTTDLFKELVEKHFKYEVQVVADTSGNSIAVSDNIEVKEKSVTTCRALGCKKKSGDCSNGLAL